MKVFTDLDIEFMVVPSAGCDPHTYDGDWSEGTPADKGAMSE